MKRRGTVIDSGPSTWYEIKGKIWKCGEVGGLGNSTQHKQTRLEHMSLSGSLVLGRCVYVHLPECALVPVHTQVGAHLKGAQPAGLSACVLLPLCGVRVCARVAWEMWVLLVLSTISLSQGSED